MSPSWNEPVSEIVAVPSLRQASFHDITGSPATQSWPSLSDRSAGGALTAGAIFLNSASRALVTAS